MALHLHIDRGQKPTTLRFSTFPVRIGRGEDVECRLEFPYVSRLHARIDLIDGRLLLQDEGSRSGTWVHDHSRRLQRGARVDLATVGNEFCVGPDLRVRVELDEQTIEQSCFVTLSGVRPRPSRVDTRALAVLQEIASTYVPYAPALGSVEAVTEFAARLDTVLSLLIEGIGAMRYAIEREAGAMSPASPIQKDLGACLLDWTNDGGYVRRLHEEIRFMLGHHRRLVDEVTDRLGRILEHLSPEAIESEPACTAGGWRRRHKTLWTEFRRRHDALVRLRERALGPVFGKVARALRGTGAEHSPAAQHELALT